MLLVLEAVKQDNFLLEGKQALGMACSIRISWNNVKRE
jgi:hypothetical protein